MSTISDNDLQQYLRTKANLGKGTIITRRSRIFIFLRWLEERQKPLITESIEQFFLYLQDEKNLTNTSLNTYQQALLSLEKYCLARNICGKFMTGFSRYQEEDPNIIPLTVEEIRLLKQSCLKETTSLVSQVNNDLTLFLIDTGARWEDAQNLRVNSVDIIGRHISYIQLKNKWKRSLLLEDPLLLILRDRIQGKGEEMRVFTNSHHGMIHYPDYYQYLKKLAKRVGITKRVSPHIIRHSYAQNFYDATGDIYLLQNLLGHKSIKSTLRYIRNSQKRMDDAQQRHPHVAENINPRIRIDLLEESLKSHAIEKDEKFDHLKVKEAFNNFILELHRAIKPDFTQF